jgi:hypothetical protein
MFLGIKVRRVRRADNLTAICELSHNPIDHHGHLRGYIYFIYGERDIPGRAVGKATGYGLHDRGVRARVPVRSRIFTSPYCPDRLWGSPSLQHNGCPGFIPWAKAAGAWSWNSLTSSAEVMSALIYTHTHTHIHTHARKVASSRPDEVNTFFSICLIIPAALNPEVYSACNRNEYQEQKNSVSGEQSLVGVQGWQPYRHL